MTDRQTDRRTGDGMYALQHAVARKNYVKADENKTHCNITIFLRRLKVVVPIRPVLRQHAGTSSFHSQKTSAAWRRQLGGSRHGVGQRQCDSMSPLSRSEHHSSMSSPDYPYADDLAMSHPITRSTGLNLNNNNNSVASPLSHVALDNSRQSLLDR